MKVQIQSYMFQHELSCEQQFGFRKQHSCTTNLLTARKRLANVLDEGECFDVVFIELYSHLVEKYGFEHTCYIRVEFTNSVNEECTPIADRMKE